MPQEIKNAVFLILSNDTDERVGTGFLVTNRLIVTCAHVVNLAIGGKKDGIPSGRLQVISYRNGQRISVRIIDVGYSPEDEYDVAFLELETDLPGVLPLRLGSAVRCAGHKYRTMGFPYPRVTKEQFAIDYIEGLGIAEIRRGSLIQLKRGAIERGMSGAPLLDLIEDRVIGMVTHGLDSSFTPHAYATPSDHLVELHFALRLVPPLLVDPPASTYVERSDEYNQVVAELTRHPEEKIVGISTALHGAGGFGKTVIAQKVCQDERIWRTFPEGMLMVTLGEKPSQAELIEKLRYLIYKLNGSSPPIPDLRTATAELKAALLGRRVLLVIDDVWDATHLHLFKPEGVQVGTLITTQRDEVLPKDAHRVWVDEMTSEQAVALLGAGLTEEAFHEILPNLNKLAHRMGYWPLLLKLANAQLSQLLSRNHEPTMAIHHLERTYDRLGLTAFDARNPIERTQATGKAIRASLDQLRPDQVDRFLELAVFPGDMAVPFAAVATLWEGIGMEVIDAELLCETLHNSSLIQHYDRSARNFTLHDIFHKYLLEHTRDTLPSLHAQLLDSYSRHCPTGWSSGPDDKYFFSYLAYHLHSARRDAELRALLLDAAWIEIRLKRGEIHELIHDYDYASDYFSGNLVQEALKLSAHVLRKEPSFLAEQFLGRLIGLADPDIDTLLNNIKNAKKGPWFCPLAPCLPPPGWPELFTLSGHTEAVDAAAFTPDGRILISGSKDASIKIWDAVAGDLIRSVDTNAGEVTALAVSPDSLYLVSGHVRGKLIIWDFPSGAPRIEIEMKFSDTVTSMAISPDGRYIITGTWEGHLQSWEIATGHKLWTKRAHERDIVAIGFSQDGKHVYTGSHDKKIQIRDVLTGEKIGLFREASSFRAVEAFSADGAYLISKADDGTLQVYNMNTRTIIQTIPMPNFWTDSLAFLPGSKCIVAVSTEGTLGWWNMASGMQLGSLSDAAFRAKIIAIHPVSEQVATGSEDGDLKLWNMRLAAQQPIIETQSSPLNAIALTPDGKRVISGATDGSMMIWDVATCKVIGGAPADDYSIQALAVTPDGRYVFCGSRSNRTIRIWDIINGTIQDMETVNWNGYSSISITSDGQNLVCGSAYDQIYRFDLHTRRMLCRYKGHRNEVIVAVTPDGKTILSGGRDGTLRRWDLATGQIQYRIQEKHGFIYTLAITNDGQSFVSGAWDGTLSHWNLEDGKNLRVMHGHTGEVYGAAFTPDGRYAISCGADRTIRAWQLDTGEQIAVFYCEAPVHACAVSPDGQSVIAADAAGRLYFLARQGWVTG